MQTSEIIEIQEEIIRRQASMVKAMALQLDTTEAWDAEIKKIERLKIKLSEDGK